MKFKQIRIAMAVVGGLVLLPVAGMAQTPQERIDAALTKAEEAGIPKSLLESKMAEGKAKGVSMDRIAAAIEARLKGLEKARDAISKGGAPDAGPDELSVGADAIGAGVSEAVLAEIANTTGRERRAVAIAALTQLVGQGIAPQSALDRVQEALARGPEALANLASQSGVAGSVVPQGSTTPGPRSDSGGVVPPVAGPPSSVPSPGAVVPQRGGPSGRGGF
jgi:hypothetical protein